MDIKFISYDGAYPNLCSGTFVVKFDGAETSFGLIGVFNENVPSGCCGGCV